MPQVFRPWINTAARVALAGLAAAAVGGTWLLLEYQRSPWRTGVDMVVEQPLQFSHARHVGGNGLDCRYCHASVETSASAGFPPTQTCMNCHAEIYADSPYLEPVRASWRTRQPIRWRRVYNLPDHVFFNHSIHLAKGIGCSTCHGRVDRMPLVRPVVPMLMEWCLDCHRHPERYVRPRSEVFSMTYAPPANQATVGAALVQAYGITRLLDCETCHR